MVVATTPFSPGRVGEHRYGDTRHNLKTFSVCVTFFVVVRITLPDRCKENEVALLH
ncbi:hypothetical protein [Desulfofundulus australicus]|uniref:hypothetical protein n=1 Tax=Desulfofundulus australicus TaxID=1566 RepID=UPI0013F4F6AD|nr:hypothetical protein [Desulfofundulus australicus]